MAGCSITLLKLDDELTRLWDAPVDTPGAAVGRVTSRRQVRDWIRRFADVVAEHRVELVRARHGDRRRRPRHEHGPRDAARWSRSSTASEGGDIGADLKAVGMALVSSVGGAAGPLYGTLFLQMGTASAGKEELDLDGWTAALEAGVNGVQARGKAEPGDKTMIDALLPARRGAAIASGGDARRRAAARRPTPPRRA